MMPRYHFPPQSGMPPHYFNPYGRPPMRHMRGMYPRMQQRGGILSKLLGKQTQASANSRSILGAFGPQPTSGGGSFLKTLTNPSSLNSVLSNTQKILNTAQQVGPVVQQYGPIVKNLPTLWKLYRGLKDAPEFNQSNNNTNDTNTAGYQAVEPDIETEPEPKSTSNNQTPLPSTPKLYI